MGMMPWEKIRKFNKHTKTKVIRIMNVTNSFKRHKNKTEEVGNRG